LLHSNHKRLLTRESKLRIVGGEEGGEWRLRRALVMSTGCWLLVLFSVKSLNPTPETNMLTNWNLNKNLKKNLKYNVH